MKKGMGSPERALRKGLREVKAGDVQIVKSHLRRILGVTARNQFALYLDGKMTLDVLKANQIEIMFRQYGVSNPWGL